MQRNVVYAAPSANAQSYSYSGYGGPPGANYAPTYSPGYYPGTPQYPPPVHGYDPQSGFAPPQGPPPGYYAPPQGPPPPGKERLDA
ncbi:hypothetical protein EIP86_007405 [Pleurotus ostreatoroseus]|nr:hypothetical protein EIP86_007405 [Pleurotus ostreatoroseus]